MLPYGVTRPQWVEVTLRFINNGQILDTNHENVFENFHIKEVKIYMHALLETYANHFQNLLTINTK